MNRAWLWGGAAAAGGLGIFYLYRSGSSTGAGASPDDSSTYPVQAIPFGDMSTMPAEMSSGGGLGTTTKPAPKPLTKLQRENRSSPPTSHPPTGDPTGSPGHRNIVTVTSRDQLAAINPSWGTQNWAGPGTYEARKFNATTPGGGSDTQWWKIG